MTSPTPTFSDGEFEKEIESILRDFNIPATPWINEFLNLFLSLNGSNEGLLRIYLTSGLGFGFEMGGGDPNKINWYGPFMAYLHMVSHGNIKEADEIRKVQRQTRDAIDKAMKK